MRSREPLTADRRRASNGFAHESLLQDAHSSPGRIGADIQRLDI
jgi:hypothetical protein